jgi:hypothetical protein
MTQLEILVNVLIAPRKAFQQIDRRPSWVLPLVLIFLFNLLTQFVVYRVIATDANFDQIARAKIEWDSSAGGQRPSSVVDPQQQVNALRRQRQQWYLIPFIAVPVVLLALALGFYVLLRLLRAGATFHKVFAVVCWSFVIYRCVGGAVVIASLLIRGPANFVPAPPEAWSPTSLAHLVSRNAVSHDEYDAISKIDIFLLWWLAAMAIGFSAISKRMPALKSAVMIGAVEIVYLAIDAAGLLRNRGG